MPYVFAITLLLNIGALGYFIFVHESSIAESPQVEEARASITKPVSITKAN